MEWNRTELRSKLDPVNYCILGHCSCFLSSADVFQNKLFEKKSFRNTIRMSSSYDPDQARQFVGSDLGPNCLPRLSADDTGRQRVDDNCYRLCIGKSSQGR